MTGARFKAVGAVALVVVCGALLSGCGAAHRGLTVPGQRDERATISLGRREAEDLRRGMRIYLESVQGIIEGANGYDMRQIASSAERSGMGMIEDLSIMAVVELPPEFVGMAIDTHQKFDELARSARQGVGKTQVMDELGAILATCTACHASYRLSR